jgi:hypothetical protein
MSVSNEREAKVIELSNQPSTPCINSPLIAPEQPHILTPPNEQSIGIISNSFTPSSDLNQNMPERYDILGRSPIGPPINPQPIAQEPLYSPQRIDDQFISTTSRRVLFLASYLFV